MGGRKENAELEKKEKKKERKEGVRLEDESQDIFTHM